MGSDKIPEKSRRGILKTGTALVGTSFLTESALAGDASESIIDQLAPEEEYQNGTEVITDVVLDHRNEHYLLSSELYTAGGRDEGDGTWEYNFHLQGQGTARRYNADESPKDGWKKIGLGHTEYN